MSTSVQLEGIEAVINAYMSRGIPAFAIFQTRNLNFSYEGNDLSEGAELLVSWLTAIQQSKATYTIKFYRSGDIKDLIRNNTPDVGALNFRLNLDPVGGRSIGEVPYYMEQRIKDLEKQNQELKEMLEADSGEDPGQENNIIGTIKQLSEIPGFSEVVTGIIGMVTGVFNKSAIPATIGNVPLHTKTMQPQEQTEVTEQEITRAASAFVHIRAAVPDALELLEKLAMKAQSDPAGLAKQLSMVKTFL